MNPSVIEREPAQAMRATGQENNNGKGARQQNNQRPIFYEPIHFFRRVVPGWQLEAKKV
jgi:hypothetical protein